MCFFLSLLVSFEHKCSSIYIRAAVHLTQSTLFFSSFTFCIDRFGTAMTVFSPSLSLLSRLSFSFSLSTDGRLVCSRFVSIRKERREEKDSGHGSSTRWMHCVVLAIAVLWSINNGSLNVFREETSRNISLSLSSSDSSPSCLSNDEFFRFDRSIVNERIKRQHRVAVEEKDSTW